jgi:cytochrome c oxidase subunit 3
MAREAAPLSFIPVATGLAMLAVGVGLLGTPLVSLLGLAGILGAAAAWTWSRWPGLQLASLPGERFSAAAAGMLTFLLSEAVLFGSLIYAYIHLRLHAMTWPPAGFEALKVGFPAVNTVVLVTSGIFAHYALASYRKGNQAASRVWLLLTVAFGAAFLGGQAYEWATLGFGLTAGLMGASFFTLTGFHGAHVSGGLLLLILMMLRTVRDRRRGLPTPNRGSEGMMAAGTYYWHFVDAVWVVLFFALYLL